MPSGLMINEEYALNHDVYVISLNESVDSEGNLSDETQHAAALKPKTQSDIPALTSGMGGMMALVNCRIDSIKPKQAKESWAAGALEVSIKSDGYAWNMRAGGTATGFLPDRYPTTRYSDDYDGHMIVKADRQEFQYGYWDINYPLNIAWAVDNFYSDPIVYAYVIFEYDATPAAVRTNASLIPSSNEQNGNTAYINYRSSDDSYGGEVAGHSANVNYAIYGNTRQMPFSFSNLHYTRFKLRSPSMDFSTEQY